MGGAWQTSNPPNASLPCSGSAYRFNCRIGNVPQTAAIQAVTIVNQQVHFDNTIKLAKKNIEHC